MVDLPFVMLDGSWASFLNKSRAWWWAVLLRTVWIALLSPSVAPLKIRSDKNQVANFTQKTKRHPQENDGLGPGNPPQQNNSGQKNEGFLVEFAGKFVETNWLSHPSEVKTFKRKRAPTRPSEWFTTGWRRKSLNLLDPKEHDIKEKRIVFFFFPEKHQKRTCHFRDDL